MEIDDVRRMALERFWRGQFFVSILECVCFFSIYFIVNADCWHILFSRSVRACAHTSSLNTNRLWIDFSRIASNWRWKWNFVEEWRKKNTDMMNVLIYRLQHRVPYQMRSAKQLKNQRYIFFLPILINLKCRMC